MTTAVLTILAAGAVGAVVGYLAAQHEPGIRISPDEARDLARRLKGRQP